MLRNRQSKFADLSGLQPFGLNMVVCVWRAIDGDFETMISEWKKGGLNPCFPHMGRPCSFSDRMDKSIGEYTGSPRFVPMAAETKTKSATERAVSLFEANGGISSHH